MRLAPFSRFVLVGDSVTDCGRRRPVGEGPGDALGHGYAADVAAHLALIHPESEVRVINQGVGGDTTRQLANRWERDVTGLNPDWLCVLIGINDVWRGFDPLRLAEAVPEAEFERTLDRLLGEIRPRLQGLVLMSPYFVEARRDEPMRARMDRYGDVVASLAARHRAHFVDLQSAFDQAVMRAPRTEWAPDRVHPGRAGHLLIARALLETIGCDGVVNGAAPDQSSRPK